MARKAKKKAKAKKTKKRAAGRAKVRAKKSAKTTRRKARVPSQRRQREPIPAEPAGRVGVPPPSAPDARLDDSRDPGGSARDIAGGGQQDGYKNTDERF